MSNFVAPLGGGLAATHHQKTLPAVPNFTPSHYSPVPLGAVLAGGVTGTAYSESITAQGGTSPYTFTVTSGALPTSTSLSSAGVISGTPTATGTFSFTVTVTDSLGFTGSQSFQISIAAPGGGFSHAFVS